MDHSRLRSLTARRLIAALERDGFVLDGQSGPHRRYVHPDRCAVTVTFHRTSDTFAPKTL